MQFKPDLAEKVKTGEKTQTRRLVKAGEWLYLSDDGSKVVFAGTRTKWKTGKTYAIQPGRGMASIGRFLLLDIRRERLGAIREQDAIAEGVDKNCPGDWQNCPGCRKQGRCDAEGEYIRYPVELNENYQAFSAVESFLSLFESINGKQAVESNPEVWVLVFEKVNDGKQ